MKILYQYLTGTLSYENMSVDKPKVLLMGPTGVAAINIDDTAIHTAVIHAGYFRRTYQT